MNINYQPPADVTLSREIVAACESEDQLQEWLEQLVTLDAEISARISADKEAGIVHRPALSKLGFIRIARSWVVARSRILNGHSRDKLENQQVELARLNNVVADLRRELQSVAPPGVTGVTVAAAGGYVTADARTLAGIVAAAGGYVTVDARTLANRYTLSVAVRDDGALVYSTELEDDYTPLGA